MVYDGSNTVCYDWRKIQKAKEVKNKNGNNTTQRNIRREKQLKVEEESKNVPIPTTSATITTSVKPKELLHLSLASSIPAGCNDGPVYAMSNHATPRSFKASTKVSGDVLLGLASPIPRQE